MMRRSLFRLVCVMDIKLENLALIPKLIEKLETIEQTILQNNIKNDSTIKRWMGTKELAEYLGYSIDNIYRLKDEVWKSEVHFYKKEGKIFFDRVAIDGWIVSGEDTNETNQSKREIVDRLLSQHQKI
jgi:hypothetical protein